MPTAPADAYWAHGAPKSLTFGNGVVETTDFNNRLQLRELMAKLGAANRLTLTYTFSTANNGNIAAQNIAGPGGSVLESYTYDAFNRLKTYTRAGGGSQTYVYDAFGNRVVLGTSSGALTPQVTNDDPADVAAQFPSNQWTALRYDAAGNVEREAVVTGRSYTYDAENRVKTAAMPGTPAITYSYDGEGRRVRKELAKQATTVFVYDAAGQLAMEFGPAAGAEVQYLTADHLGSTRLVTDKNGAEVKRLDFLPFGEEYPAVGYPSATEKTLVKFTGKERDAETGLDYFGARYMSAAQGRLVQPDPVSATITHLVNPQKWNMYAYSINNPLYYIDPDGRDAIAVNLEKQVPGAGHSGFFSVHRNGRAQYISFLPKGGGKPSAPGEIRWANANFIIEFEPNGVPTRSSYRRLAELAASVEGQDPSTVRMNYFRTSESDTAAQDAWIERIAEAWSRGQAPWYDVTRQNCATFCIAGLIQGRAIKNEDLSQVPNRLFDLLVSRAADNYSPRKEKEHPSTIRRRCLIDRSTGQCVQ